MRKYILLIGLTLTLLSVRGQAINDSLSIRAVLDREAATWRSGDVKGHADCWQVRTYSRILVSLADGRSLDVAPSLMINPPATMTGGGGSAKLTNVKMSIHGSSAWVSHDEESITKAGVSTFSREIRMLEKVNGQWKLVGQSTHMYKPE